MRKLIYLSITVLIVYSLYVGALDSEGNYCSETDTGIDQGQKSRTEIWSYDEAGSPVQLYWEEDICIDDDTLIEYSCDRTEFLETIRKDIIKCPSSGLRCVGDRCVPVSCTDSDSDNLDYRGTVSGSIDQRKYNYTDYCFDGNGINYLKEYYCDGDLVRDKDVICLMEDKGDCLEGACTGETDDCIDSEGPYEANTEYSVPSIETHHNAFAFGTVEVFDLNGKKTTLEDGCWGGNSEHVREYYCEMKDGKGVSRYVDIDCTVYGTICSKGACVKQVSCNDNDKGDLLKSGNAILTSQDGTTTALSDGCYLLAPGGNDAFEATCDGDDIAFKDANCKNLFGEGYVCYYKRCMKPLCEDLDGNNHRKASNIILTDPEHGIKEPVEDSCEGNILTEELCDPVKGHVTERVDCADEGGICLDGRCLDYESCKQEESGIILTQTSGKTIFFHDYCEYDGPVHYLCDNPTAHLSDICYATNNLPEECRIDKDDLICLGNGMCTLQKYCKATETCLEGECRAVRCDEPESDGFYVKTTVTLTDITDNKILEQKEDKCLGITLTEYSCQDASIEGNPIDCTSSFQTCDDGACVDVASCKDEDGNNIFESSTILVELLSGKSQTLYDRCLSSRHVGEYICKDNGENKLVPWQLSVECPEGQVCSGGRCGVSDLDGDGVLDAEDNCQDTMMTDPVDGFRPLTMGCSCYQQKALGVSDRVVSIGLETSSCEELEAASEPCGAAPEYCCNKIYDGPDKEVLVDCGRKCEKCNTQCKKIVDGGPLSIVLIPIGYSASDDVTIKNQDDWKLRAGIEALGISTTPPFCESAPYEEVLAAPAKTSFLDKAKCDGKLVMDKYASDFGYIVSDGEFNPLVTVYRVDLYSFDPEFQKKVINFYESDLAEKENFQDYVKLNTPEYMQFCSDAQMITYLVHSPLYVGFGGQVLGFSTNLETNFNVVYDHPSEINVITHETGHSFCGVDDIYIYAEYGTAGYEVQKNSKNCDKAPVKTEADGVSTYKCRWQYPPGSPERRDYPFSYYDEDAGCKPGCVFAEYSSASEPEVNSMMNQKLEIGPYKYGIGSWDYISYAACQDMVREAVSK